MNDDAYFVEGGVFVHSLVISKAKSEYYGKTKRVGEGAINQLIIIKFRTPHFLFNTKTTLICFCVVYHMSKR